MVRLRGSGTLGGLSRVGKTWSWALCTALILAFCSSVAHATPQTFNFVMGTATITASTASNPVLGAVTVDLDGAFVEFDAAPAGLLVADLVDFSITTSDSGVIMLSNPWGGATEFTIVSASLTPGTGYATTGATGSLPFFTIDGGPVDITATFTTDLNPMVEQMLGATSPTLSATMQTDLVQLGMLGITLFELPGAAFMEPEDLVVKADITWFGVVPEPSTGLLVAFGLLGCVKQSRQTPLVR